MAEQQLKKNADNYLELREFTSTLTGALITGATVTAVLEDSGGNQVTGGPAWPATMAEVDDGRGGTYRLLLPSTLNITVGQRYKAKVTGSKAGESLNEYKEIDILCVQG